MTMYKKLLSANRAAWPLALAVFIFSVPMGEAQKAVAGATETLRAQDRYQLTATLLDKSGKPKPVHATVRQWDILGNQKLQRFPSDGFMLVRLIGGRVTTVIEGKEQKRHHGEVWTVAPNQPMSLTAVGEDATLEVVTFSTQ
jgi:quercetin dioxygenase-like cupin family protein